MNKLYVIGLGPGSPGLITPEAEQALINSECIVGYSLYLDLIPNRLKIGKQLISSAMRQETERCRAAIACACSGRPSAIVCSGDPGIYAMASLVIELLEKDNLLKSLELEIVAGVPAFCAGAALLGAPVAHDFACISLSDLLTPLEIIWQRLEAALQADFVCVIYNPRSRGRKNLLANALKIAAKYRKPDCPVGLVRNVGRSGEFVLVSTLSAFDCECVDMLSLIILGNSQTRATGAYMLTPRGYAQNWQA